MKWLFEMLNSLIRIEFVKSFILLKYNEFRFLETNLGAILIDWLVNRGEYICGILLNFKIDFIIYN